MVLALKVSSRPRHLPTPRPWSVGRSRTRETRRTEIGAQAGRRLNAHGCVYVWARGRTLHVGRLGRDAAQVLEEASAVEDGLLRGDAVAVVPQQQGLAEPLNFFTCRSPMGRVRAPVRAPLTEVAMGESVLKVVLMFIRSGCAQKQL